MKLADKYQDEIKVQVTKRLPKREIASVVRDFIDQRLTFAVSQHEAEYEVWRQVLPGDRPRVKNRKEGMVPAGIIEEDLEDLNERNFVCIWDHGKKVAGDFDVN